MGRPEGKKLLGRPGSTWEDNIKFILNKWDGGMDGISPAHDRGETGGGRL